MLPSFASCFLVVNLSLETSSAVRLKPTADALWGLDSTQSQDTSLQNSNALCFHGLVQQSILKTQKQRFTEHTCRWSRLCRSPVWWCHVLAGSCYAQLPCELKPCNEPHTPSAAGGDGVRLEQPPHQPRSNLNQGCWPDRILPGLYQLPAMMTLFKL